MGFRRQGLQQAFFVPDTHVLSGAPGCQSFAGSPSRSAPTRTRFACSQRRLRWSARSAKGSQRSDVGGRSGAGSHQGQLEAARAYGTADPSATQRPTPATATPVAPAKRRRGRLAAARCDFSRARASTWKSREERGSGPAIGTSGRAGRESAGPSATISAAFSEFSTPFPNFRRLFRISGARPTHQRAHRGKTWIMLQPIAVHPLFGAGAKTNPRCGASMSHFATSWG